MKMSRKIQRLHELKVLHSIATGKLPRLSPGETEHKREAKETSEDPSDQR